METVSVNGRAVGFMATAGLCLVLGWSLANADLLSEQEKRGKEIFLHGKVTGGAPVVALFGDEAMEIPATALPCGNCHGFDGRGRPEGGVSPPDITWANLIRPGGHHHETGREHAVFAEETVIRAIRQGLDPDGQALTLAMPRYRIPDVLLEDLLAYLKRLGEQTDPGLSDQTVRVGTILPGSGPMQEMGDSMLAVMQSYFDDVNASGGLYQRKLELAVARSDGTVGGIHAATRDLLAANDIFALNSPIIAGDELLFSDLVRQREIPTLAPFTLYPEEGFPLNRYIFYLLPGLLDQLRVLVDFAADTLAQSDPVVAIIHGDEPGVDAPIAAIERRGRLAGWKSIQRYGFIRDQFDPDALVSELRRDGTEDLFLLIGGNEEMEILAAAARQNWFPRVFMSGMLAGPDIGQMVQDFRGKIFLAFATMPVDRSRNGVVKFTEFMRRHNIEQRHVSAQISAYCAAELLVDGLKEAGKDLSREGLVAALEGFYDYDIGLLPRISYGPNRRVGVRGAYVVSMDIGQNKVVPVGGWHPLK